MRLFIRLLDWVAAQLEIQSGHRGHIVLCLGATIPFLVYIDSLPKPGEDGPKEAP